MTDDAVLAIRNLAKRFGQTLALDGVDLTVRRGEILGLVGGNGAGKSTLLKIVTGVYQADRGEMVLDGQEYRPRSPADATERHVALIPQELRVVPAMSVADNVMLGHWARHAGLPLVNRRTTEALARERLAALGVEIDPRKPIGSLSFAARQSVVIARAMARQARLLILDEPTAALGAAEVDRLFDMILRLKAQGTALIYVSHRLDEIGRLCDRVTALRDGRVVASLARGGYSQHDLVVAISGQQLRQARHHPVSPPGPVWMPPVWQAISSDRRRGLRSDVCQASERGLP
ncbi:ATP-binding cassette domain-containing protein [Gemmobacter sp.]|uniref:ATP-binding cassette domain-containing protein n=1 Tax=Gemmobacter sp. TaxID=1898957 RepID=UPI002AFDDDDF|nr:ATP-binding cassette domain-containing protein [Gemmobacter sp.]